MNASLPWWQNGVIYQIYPKSFQDSTGSGIGDIAGVTARFDYLQQLGVDAIWLTPVYLSPQVDNGYDVADYCAIDPTYGTMADMETLIAQAHQRRIRVVMDMVFNHTSTQHHWFLNAQDRRSPYRHFYIWRDGNDGALPNNWRSKFGGPAWQWHVESKQYYLHLFATEQADLNWEHPRVRDELKQVCEFWADKGVDGLRLDVINLVSKQQDFPSDAQQGDGRRFYTDGPLIHDYLQEFSQDVFQPRGLMTVGEMSSTSLEHCRRYAALDGSELSMTFNFHHLKVDYPNGEKWTLAEPDFIQLKQIFNHWQQGMHNHAWNALFWCNHDQPRIVSRFGDEGEFRVQSAKMLAMVLHGMQGTPYIYQGEELGMTNPGYTQIEQYHDIESLNQFAEQRDRGQPDTQTLAILASKSRDNGRTPMQWDASKHAGFTSGTPWIALCQNFTHINAEQALVDKESVFYTYQQLIAMRKALPLLTHGDYQDLLPDHPTVWCYQRIWEGQRLLVLANLSKQPQRWQPPIDTHDRRWRLLLSNYPDAQPQPAILVLRPFEAIYWVQGMPEKEGKV
ncbi:alpha,alpha-phosphotrehalase [Pectobacterium parvum]|uniref:Alpha,alpha-phosphotrehalase n=1 Tax=Pectobacterium parvum TaxID=2778550 RepID=A0AAP9IK56_9GAMM|nr:MULTISPECIES: alpha,alpha-phosphotrehalase [Pectobacterium]KFX14792.1 trehalose-6-phosphate hydrolase [Pectobacterium parvum]KHS92707.1 trehalose-6-phosphate hydrolase [Pectobacterium parvum]MCU1802110.1 alpha,alpha-phosphotrehalase [Pectobacterium parvum]QHQ26717.1 alpha,alpha-phosphotrehalase [Pectobacterium parvum]UFK41293.1 alpha,alpha-phosphotrehalase [Pectobacterium parvum]